MLNRLEVSHTFNYIKLVFNFGLFTATIYKVYFYHFYIFRLDNITIHIFLQKKKLSTERERNVITQPISATITQTAIGLG